MNWSKGKNRLIILFLSINVLLGWANYKKVSGVYNLKDNQIYDIKQVMATSNIFVDSEIPREYKPLQKLTVFPYQIDSKEREVLVKQLLQTLDGVKVSLEAPKVPNEPPKRIYKKGEEIVIFEGEKIKYYHHGISELANPDEPSEDKLVTGSAIDLNQKQPKQSLDINMAKRFSEKWLKQLGYSPKEMHMQVIRQNNDLQMIYYDKYEGIPVFDSYVNMFVTPFGVSDIEIHKVNLGDISGEKQEIYPSDQVFFHLIQEIASDKPVYIKEIMLGYALENPRGTHLIAEKAIPFYQIILEDGKTYYIDAYNNEIIE